MTDNTRACLLMIASMAGFAGEDLFIKLAAETLPVGEVLMIVGLGGTLVMLAVARAHRVSLFDPLLLHPAVLLRNLGEAGVLGFGFTALALLPLSIISSIQQAAPLVTTMAAATVMGEQVGWRRWTAVIIGLIGVLLILRPGSAAFDPAMLLAACAVLAMSLRDLSTRRVPRGLRTVQLNFWGYSITLPSGLIMLLAEGGQPALPDTQATVYLAAATVLGVVFYFTLTMALRLGEASLVIPFRYSRLLFALILAMIVLGERPAPLAYAGMALVIGAGLYTLLREARLGRRTAAAAFPRSAGIGIDAMNTSNSPRRKRRGSA